MNILSRKCVLLLVTIVTLSSCQSYRPLALMPDEVLQELETERNKHDLEKVLTFERATRIMSENNLTLKRLQQAYNGKQAVAGIKTPWPNPELEFGLATGRNLAEKTASATQPFVGLGFSIPLGPRLRRNDDLNHIEALKAYNQQLIEHRSLYFQLSRAYVNLSLTARIQKAQDSIRLTLNTAQASTEKRHKIGVVDKLGVTAVKIQLAELELENMETQVELQERHGVLANLLVISGDSFIGKRTQALPLPKTTKTLDELKTILLNNNFDLAQIEMDFHASDAELRVELAKQYPDLHIGLSYENEVGEKTKTLSIPFSIELPVFDRNRQEIALAISNREERVRLYKERLHALLVRLETAYHQYAFSLKKLDFANKRLLPLVGETVRNAERSLKLGAISSLRYLDFLANQQQVLLEKVRLENECWSRLQEIEMLIGVPLVQLQTAPLLPFTKSLRKAVPSKSEK